MFHVVDDVPELREILGLLIESEGYKSMQFDSAESYMEYFNSPEYIAPIAILTDYMMPGKTGLQLIKVVRAKLPHQKAVIVSGTPCEVLGSTVDKYLCYSLDKPYKPEKLFALLEALINCDKHCLTDAAGFRKKCEYGLEHECPFHPD